jgi:hypothetical protein
MTPQAATSHTALSARSLYDSHCHPQVEGERSLRLLRDVQAGGMAVMSTRRDDWPLVAQLFEQSPQRGARLRQWRGSGGSTRMNGYVG